METCVNVVVQHGIGLSNEVEEILISMGSNHHLRLDIAEFEKLREGKASNGTLFVNEVLNKPVKRSWKDRLLSFLVR
jgi:hypothetical protein